MSLLYTKNRLCESFALSAGALSIAIMNGSTLILPWPYCAPYTHRG